MSLTRPICNVCNSDETKIKFVKTGIKIWICKKCSFIFVHPPPSIKTQKEYYDQSHKSGLYKIHSDDDVPIRIKLNKKRYEELISYKPKWKHLIARFHDYIMAHGDSVLFQDKNSIINLLKKTGFEIEKIVNINKYPYAHILFIAKKIN